MKSPLTWGEYKTQFEQGTEPLAAMRDSTNVRREAIKLTAILNERLESENKPSPDSAYGLARAAARAARVPADEQGRQWFFRGAKSSVQMFHSVASRAARAAGCISPEANQEVATIAWLTLVFERLGDARELDDEDIRRAHLSNVWAASARVCDVFEFEGKPCIVSSPIESSTSDQPSPERAVSDMSATLQRAEEQRAALDTHIDEGPAAVNGAMASRIQVDPVTSVPPAEPMDPSRTMTRKEAARVLRTSVDTLDRMRRDGEIKMFQVRRRWMVLASEVQRIRQQPKFKDLE
jgi:excisionase family DNA binding protein